MMTVAAEGGTGGLRGVEPVVVQPQEEAGPLGSGGFDRLFSDERVVMVRLAWLLTGSEPLAEEITQDAQVFERWDKLDNPGGYLRSCVVNGSRRAERRRSVERRHAPGAEPDPSVSGGEDVAAPDLVAALRTLQPKRRAAVVLRYWGGYSQAEVADALGVRVGTVKSMLHRALADLRKVVEP